ncbi:MAG: ATP-binding protein [Sterolibacterium sp.]|jgi:signal transduction histidine kinase
MEVLLAAAIHDAKNALNSLGVWLDKAQLECGGQSPALIQAKAVTATISGQLVELLALYRAGEGNLRMAVEDQYLEDFLSDLMAELSATRPVEDAEGGAARSIATDFAAAKDIGAWAFDAYLVKFVLLDALRNASRHAREQIRFSIAEEPGGGIRFDVADDGAGYPEEILRAESTAKMTPESSGLGLSFARVIAERHATPAGRHGRVELANDGLGKGGARLSLILP